MLSFFLWTTYISSNTSSYNTHLINTFFLVMLGGIQLTEFQEPDSSVSRTSHLVTFLSSSSLQRSLPQTLVTGLDEMSNLKVGKVM